jgi:hypothetical protein
MIYLTGVVFAIILGWFSIMDAEDEECSLVIPECALIAVPILAIFSWLAVILIILVEFKKRR